MVFRFWLGSVMVVIQNRCPLSSKGEPAERISAPGLAGWIRKAGADWLAISAALVKASGLKI
ncbi:MAG: hypothetical protein AB8A39_00025 [Prochlorococcus sp.]